MVGPMARSGCALGVLLLMAPAEIRAAGGLFEWERDVVAPSLDGAIGLLRMRTTDVGRPLSLRVGVHGDFMQQDSLLVSGSGAQRGDADTRYGGTITVGFTLADVFLLRNLELFASASARHNSNVRTDPARSDPVDERQLGSLTFGLQGAGYLGAGFSLGASAMGSMPGGMSGGPSIEATSVDTRLLVGWDARRLGSAGHGLPLRLHLDAGYLDDRSIAVLPPMQCATSVSNDACIRSRLVERFAFDVASSRVRIAVGVELPLVIRAGRGRVGLSTFLEWHYEHAIGDGDQVTGDALDSYAKQVQVTCPVAANTATCEASVARLRENISRPSRQFATFGVRVRPGRGLVLDLAVDTGLEQFGYRHGPPIPRWNLLAGFAYSWRGPQ